MDIMVLIFYAIDDFVKSLSRGGSSACRNYRWDGVGKERRVFT